MILEVRDRKMTKQEESQKPREKAIKKEGLINSIKLCRDSVNSSLQCLRVRVGGKKWRLVTSGKASSAERHRQKPDCTDLRSDSKAG